MSVTAPQGFTAAGIAAGIKENGNRDLALVVNNGPHSAAAGVFTSNRVQAAPVQWSRPPRRLIFGDRPNSPAATTRVFRNSPRRSRSRIRAV